MGDNVHTYGRRKRDYLELLERLNGDISEAVKATEGMTPSALMRFRELDWEFRKREAEILGKNGNEVQKREYLKALRKFVGNKSKARARSACTKEMVDSWGAADRAFKDKEAEIYESFVDDMNEQTIRLATGRKSPVKDAGHLREVLKKVDPRWRDDPKVIEHKYSGEIGVKSIDDEIIGLLEGEA